MLLSQSHILSCPSDTTYLQPQQPGLLPATDAVINGQVGLVLVGQVTSHGSDLVRVLTRPDS